MPVPLALPPAGGSQMAMQDATQTANPRALISQPVGTSGPTAEDTSSGIIDQLKTIVQAAEAIAGTNPQIAEQMQGIQKLCIQAALSTQQQAASPPAANSMPYAA